MGSTGRELWGGCDPRIPQPHHRPLAQDSAVKVKDLIILGQRLGKQDVKKAAECS